MDMDGPRRVVAAAASSASALDARASDANVGRLAEAVREHRAVSLGFALPKHDYLAEMEEVLAKDREQTRLKEAAKSKLFEVLRRKK